MVYEGNEKYIFISYAHKDGDKVLPILEAMAKDGYRLWYDSGIEAGTEWPEYIEERLTAAHVVLAFMSPAAVDSQNCRNEINFALELKKEVLVVYLEETTLRKGMRLQLNSSQSLFRNKHKTEGSFLKELLNARILADCRKPKETPPAPKPVTPQPEAPVQEKRKTPSSAVTIAGISIGVIALLLCAIVLIQNAIIKHNIDNSPQASATEPTATTEPLKMSDNLFDYILELEGVVYQFPCSFQDLAGNGWTISTHGISDTSMMMGGGYEQYEMTKNGKTITVSSYNQSGNAVALKDCPINGLIYDAYSNVEVTLAKGITVHSTVEEIITAYGSPTAQDESENYVTLTYQQEGDEYSGIRFRVSKIDEPWNSSGVELEHIVIQEVTDPEVNTERPAYLDEYKAPTSLSDDATMPVVELGGDLYQLPCPVSEFYNNGWVLDSLPCYIKAGNTEYITLKRGDALIDVHIGNYSDYQTTIENCAVFQLYIRTSSNTTLKLSGGIALGMSVAQLESVIPASFTHYTSGDNHNWAYRQDSPRKIYLYIEANTVEDQVILIEIKGETWDYT